MKKKIYKKWWFWVIAVIGIVIINAIINPEEFEKEQQQIAIEQKAEAEKEAKEVAAKKAEEQKEKQKEDERNKKSTIIATTQEVVKKNLKCPSTAKFPWGFDEYTITESKSENKDRVIYNIAGYVDAENSFGAKLRNNFIVKLECTKDLSKYRTLDVSITE